MNICGDSRKIRAFIVMSIAITLFVIITTYTKTHTDIVTYGLWTLCAGGLFTIGGQSLVDTMEKIFARLKVPPARKGR